MKSTIALVSLASLAASGIAAANAPPQWQFETTAPPYHFEEALPLSAPLPPPLPAPLRSTDAYPSFPYRPWLRGERQRYEPSTLAVYQVPAAPPNNCGPSLFEVMNPDPGDAPCVAVQRRRWHWRER